MADDSLVDRLVAADAVRFGEFELSHGGTSEYYVDKYRFETDPGCLRALADAFAERFADIEGDSGSPADDPPILAGVALGAVPLVAATSVAADRPYVIVRKSAKEYGTGNRIEGDLPDGARVIVIEDVATTGQSAVDAAEALREAGATVERVLVVVDREEGASEHLAEHDLQLDALLTASDLLAVAED